MVSVLGVEAGIIDEVDAATDHVTRGKGGPVRLPRARRTERVPVVAVVTVRVLVPTCAPHSTISLLFAGVNSLICRHGNPSSSCMFNGGFPFPIIGIEGIVNVSITNCSCNIAVTSIDDHKKGLSGLTVQSSRFKLQNQNLVYYSL